MQIQQTRKDGGIALARRVSVAVQEVFGVSVADMLGEGMLAKHMPARRCFYVVMRDLGFSAKQIALYAGKNDHATVLYGLNLGAYEIATEEAFKHKVNRVRLMMGVAEGKDMAQRTDRVMSKVWKYLPVAKQVMALADKEEKEDAKAERTPRRKRVG